MAGEVLLDAKLSYQNVLVTSENKMVYMLIDLKAGKEVSYGPAPLNLSIVIDKSGSMYQAEKLEYVIDAVQYVIDQLRPGDIISIVPFADKSRVLIPAGQIFDKESAKKMIRNIDQVDVGSGTEMLKGINAAISEVKKNFSRDRTNHIILLTDGLTLHENKCKDECRRTTEFGISFSTIGVGDDFNEKLLIDIANSCRGKSYYIDIPRDIPNIFAQELQGVQSVMVMSPTLKVKLMKDIEARRVFKVKPLITDMGTLPAVDKTITVTLSDLQKNEPQSVLFELVLPSRQAGTYRVGRVEAIYSVPQAGSEVIGQDILINYTLDQALASVVNPQVMNVIDLVSVFRQQTRALEFAKSGDKAKATKLLRSAATTLLDHGHKELADQALAEAQRIEKGTGATSAGTKKLEYGTRKLTQLLDQLPM
ncbi:MAG: VWA domain-containing protein [Candidatus Eremiobacteraeota bacterium]|nr:VWA domain-containing protein [Candidatus Eremiobacteraeota bacterium]